MKEIGQTTLVEVVWGYSDLGNDQLPKDYNRLHGHTSAILNKAECTVRSDPVIGYSLSIKD